MYSLILFRRIAVWIALGIVGILVVIFSVQDITNGFYYFAFSFYVALGLYNLHVALFWNAEELAEIEEI